MRTKSTRYLVQAAVIAAIYTALTYAGFGFAYGPWQFRIAEALCILPALTPAAIPGLTVGCILANILSSYGILDVIFGSLATFLAAVSAYLLRGRKVKGMPLLSPLCAVLFNALIVSAVIVIASGQPHLYWINALQIGVTEAVVCYGLGLPLYHLIEKTDLLHL